MDEGTLRSRVASSPPRVASSRHAPSIMRTLSMRRQAWIPGATRIAPSTQIELAKPPRFDAVMMVVASYRRGGKTCEE